MTTDRSHRRYKENKKRLFARAKATDAACVLCGQAIDWDADPNDNLAPSADHIEAVSRTRPGGNGMFGKLQITHRICNIRKSSKTMDEYLAGQVQEARPTLVWGPDCKTDDPLRHNPGRPL